MASIGNALVSKILGHSAAEKAFRPWWDNLEDFLVYGLVMLGKISDPHIRKLHNRILRKLNLFKGYSYKSID